VASFEQYIVDGWAAAEQVRLNWIRLNQGRLHADLYHHVVNAFSDSDNITILRTWAVNSSCLLPSGSSRDMCESKQNSLALDADMVHQMAF